MLLFRILAWGLAFFTGSVLVYDLIFWVINGSFHLVDIGTIWFTIDSESLQLAEPAVARYLHPMVWHPIISTVLLWPAVMVFGIPAALLFWLSRRRPNSIFRSN